MDKLPEQEKNRILRRYVLMPSVLLLVILIAYTSWFWNNHINAHIVKIKNAPIDPTEASDFAFFNFEPQPEELVDIPVNIGCYGHDMTRTVHQFINIDNNQPAIPLLVVNGSNISSGQFPLSTTFKEIPVLSNGRYTVKKDLLPSNLTLKKSLTLKELLPRPAQWKKISSTEYFWGQNPKSPQAGNISVRYTCRIVPALSLWGSVDISGRITPDSWLNGVSLLSATKQKQHLIDNLETFKMSSLAIHIFILTALFLIFIKECFKNPKWRRIAQIFITLRQYDILLSPAILLIQPSFITALLTTTFLAIYRGCCFFAQQQEKTLSEIERIYFYR